jgi:hypothetical protein
MNTWFQTDIDADVLFFAEKLAREKDPARQEKIKKQIALLQDAVVIYGKYHGGYRDSDDI